MRRARGWRLTRHAPESTAFGLGLTLPETAVVVELFPAIACRRGHPAWLPAAGDDGRPCVRRVSSGAR